LILYPERLAGQQPEMANKELLQSATLVDYLSQYDPDALTDAWTDLLSRGPSWRKLAKQGLAALKQRYPEANCAI